MEAIRVEMYQIADQYKPMTVRQVFYQLVSRGLIEKTEAEYNRTVCRSLARLRRTHVIPYDWIADNNRRMCKPITYDSAEDALQNCQQTYRRALWNDQDCYVQVWLEKEALSGVLIDITEKVGRATNGDAGGLSRSISFLHSASEVIAAQDRPVYLYYFGDHDPSGVDIDRFTEKKILSDAPDCDLTFNRIAVLREQIKELQLPTRPTKRSDSRAKSFRGNSVEVDAIDPDTLRGYATNASCSILMERR